MKKTLLFLSFLIFAFTNASGQFFQWAKKLNHDNFTGNAITANDNFVVASSCFVGTINIDNITMTASPAGNHNAYLTKHDRSGNLLWAKQILTKDINYTTVKIDVNDNIYVAGTYIDYLTIGQSIFVNPTTNTSRVFLAKFSPEGQFLWAKNAEVTPVNVSPYLRIGTDTHGNVFLSGEFHNPIKFGPVTLTSSGWTDVFLAKYDYKGAMQWVKKIGGAAADEIAHITISPLNNIYLSYLTNYNAIQVQKYAQNGNLIWTNSVNSTNGVISVDEAENVYLAGSYGANLSFGPIQLPYTGTGTLFRQQYFIAKINNTGQWKWAKPFITGNYDMRSFKRVYAVALDPVTKDHINIAATISDSGTINNQLFKNATIVAKLDTAGNAQKAVAIYADPNNTQGVHNIATDSYGNNYVSGYFDNLLKPGGITLTDNQSNYWPGYITKILENANTLTGSFFIDSNNNGTKEINEPPYPNGIVAVNPGNINLSTDLKGYFNLKLDTGTYTLSPISPSNHYTFTPQNHTVTFGGLGQLHHKDFAIKPIPNRNDIKVTVTNLTPARPGFLLKYRITYENVGTTTISDSIILNYNNQRLTYTAASVIPALTKAGKIGWFYQALAPQGKRNIDVQFQVAASTPINTQLMAHALAYPITDFFGWNNQDTLLHAVTGSYDPNDKAVNHSKLTPTQVANGKLLDYVIRFQNTGNDTAFTVIVRDSISSKLHMPSFELLSASHAYTFRLLENGMAEWRFDNIKLVDSTRNERGSHGFIRYRVQPKNNLVLGDEIKTRAAIYFDYNEPVMTNLAVTRVSNITGNRKDNAELQAFELYPNPAKNYVMVAADLKKQTVATIILKNLLGQTISEITLPANNTVKYQVPLNNLAKGVYIVQLETDTGRQTQRLVIQ